MGRSQLTVAGAAAAFGLATVIVAAQAPKPPAGRGQGQPAAAQPGGPPPNPADPSLPQGQGGGRGTGAPVFQSARATIKGTSGMTGTATFYEISNGGDLPNITINAQGTGQFNIYPTRLTMGGPTGCSMPMDRPSSFIRISTQLFRARPVRV